MPGHGATEPRSHRDRALQPGTVSWIPVLFLLLTCCTGGGPQPVLQQPPSASAPSGTTVRLSCTLSSDSSVSLHSISWYQQRPGHPPRLLLKHPLPLDRSQDPEIPPRFSGSKDVASNTAFLTISELQPEDEAVYFCAVGSLSTAKGKGWEGGKGPAFSGSQEPRDMHASD